MIRKIHGTLEAIEESSGFVATPSGLTYEVLLSAYTAARLGPDIGRPVTLHTHHYLEGASQGANLTPRLAGFVSEDDRAFFELLKSVNRVGPRKALRAMALATHQIAAAIEDRDIKLLQSLPEVGKRTAETIVATLSGKIDRFVAGAAGGRAAGEGAAAAESPSTRSVTREALEVLVQLGENRTNALQWIDDALTANPDLDDPQLVVTEVLRRRAGV